MANQFECLKCGQTSLLESLPAKCANCGHGNGVIREQPESPATPVKPGKPQPDR